MAVPAAVYYAALAITAASAVDTAAQQRKKAREQRRLQRLQERRERIKTFTESRRALAETQANLVAKGAQTSSAASTVPGSIRTQEASSQNFLSTVSRITGNINTFNQRAQTSQAVGAISGQVADFALTGSREGLFGTPKQG